MVLRWGTGSGFAMLSDQRHSVVIAVWRTQQRMDMKLFGLLIFQEHTGVMVELNEGNGTLDPIVERVVRPRAANPAKPNFAGTRLDCVHARALRTHGKVPVVNLDQIQQLSAQERRQIARRNPPRRE